MLALWWYGRGLYGVLEVLPTPAGDSVRDVYASGALLGASMRAWASLSCAADSRSAVQDDLQLLGYACRVP